MTRKLPFEYKWVDAVIFVLGMFMEIMDMTIVNVAIPTLQATFKTTGSGIEWVVIGSLLSRRYKRPKTKPAMPIGTLT